MGVIDLVARAVSGPAGRMVEAPVRTIVEEAFRQADLPRAPELAGLRAELSRLTADLHALRNQLTELAQAVQAVQADAQQGLAELRLLVDAQSARTQEARDQAVARAEALSAAGAAALESALAAQAQTLAQVQERSAQSVEALRAQVGQLSARLDAGASAPAAEPAAEPAPAPEPAPAAEPAPPAEPAPAAEPEPAPGDGSRPGRRSLSHLRCKEPGCEDPHRSKGFCSRHYQSWRRGRLEGYIGLNGLLELGDRTLRFDPTLEAEPYTTEGEGAALRVLVDGRPVPFELA